MVRSLSLVNVRSQIESNSLYALRIILKIYRAHMIVFHIPMKPLSIRVVAAKLKLLKHFLSPIFHQNVLIVPKK